MNVFRRSRGRIAVELFKLGLRIIFLESVGFCGLLSASPALMDFGNGRGRSGEYSPSFRGLINLVRKGEIFYVKIDCVEFADSLEFLVDYLLSVDCELRHTWHLVNVAALRLITLLPKEEILAEASHPKRGLYLLFVHLKAVHAQYGQARLSGTAVRHVHYLVQLTRSIYFLGTYYDFLDGSILPK